MEFGALFGVGVSALVWLSRLVGVDEVEEHRLRTASRSAELSRFVQRGSVVVLLAGE